MTKLKKIFMALLSLMYGLVIGAFFIYVFCSQFCFLISETNSLAYNYFLQIKNLKPKLGNYTVYFSEYLNRKVVKKIVGIEGDAIWYDDLKILYINSKKIGTIYTKAHNKSLIPIKAQVIPTGYVFLAGTNDLSFDSRYQNLGLASISLLEGLVVPLL